MGRSQNQKGYINFLEERNEVKKMTIFNLLMIFGVIILGIIAISYYVQNKKNAEVETMDVDDSKYTLTKMIEFVKKRLDEITKINLYAIL